MTKALTYVEIDVPPWAPSVVSLSFEQGSRSADKNTGGYSHTWTAEGTVLADSSGGALGLGDLDLTTGSPAGGRIWTPAATEFELGSDDFTIEFYFWNGNTPTGGNICGQRISGGTNATRVFNIDFGTVPGPVTAKVHQDTTQTLLTGTTVFQSTESRWHHVSFVRFGDVLMLFVDGVMEASATFTGAVNTSSGALAIGWDGDDPTTPYVGWIDEFTIHKYARRTGNFTPEKAGSGSQTVWVGKERLAYVSLLHFDTDFVDQYRPSRTWTAAGNAQISTSDSVFGGGSLLLDGTGDWLTTTSISDVSAGTRDFTIEFWIKFATSGTEHFTIGQCDASGGNSTNTAWYTYRTTGDVFGYAFAIGTGGFAVEATGVVGGSWFHIAISRQGNVLMIFKDGHLAQSLDMGASYSQNTSTAKIGIGNLGDFTFEPMNGRIDEFRWTIGVATRTEDFIPPDRAFANLDTFRFAVDTGYLPPDIDAIPSITEVTIDPATLSLGENLGTRATATASFRDHRHSFDGEPFDSGSFWGKFRARYGVKLRGYPMRVLYGELGDTLEHMETHHYVIESTDGPNGSGQFNIKAKDVLKFADGDRAQAPVPSNGYLVAGITNVATTATLSPTGIGDSEYPASGLVAIGGTEICSFTRGVPTSGDVLTLTRAQKNTTAVAHNAQERVQLVLQYTSSDPATIIRDLLVNYADVPTEYISLASWQAEVNAYLNTLYTATIAEPTSVADLISELIEQVGLIIWWDDIGQRVNLQVLRPIPTDADVISGDNYMAGTLRIEEQPEKRLTRVYTYFAKLNALVEQDQLTNYRSTSYVVDDAAEADYGTPVIKKIFSRWIPDGGRSVADNLGTVLLARFRDPPRKISLSVLRGSIDDPVLGVGHQVEGWPIQDVGGGAAMVAAQVTSVNPKADVFEVELEEISENSFATGGASPNEHDIIFDSNVNEVNLRTTHDALYGVPASGVAVVCTINAGVIIGSASTSSSRPAFNVGTWPAGVTVLIINNGRIQGKGGAGGNGAALTGGAGGAGSTGGTALKATQAFTLNNISGQIWAGGGGGGGNGGNGPVIGGQTFYGVAGGGGGSGTSGGAGGVHSNGSSGSNATSGSAGTSTAGGAGGSALGAVGPGGAGGGPGLNGSSGSAGAGAGSGAAGGGGSKGKAIDGVSFVTFAGGNSPNGDIRGTQSG